MVLQTTTPGYRRAVRTPPRSARPTPSHADSPPRVTSSSDGLTQRRRSKRIAVVSDAGGAVSSGDGLGADSGESAPAPKGFLGGITLQVKPLLNTERRLDWDDEKDLIHDTYRLVKFEELPYFLRDNVFITGSYRVYFSAKLCLESMIRMHNDTGNIWSHLLGCVLFVGVFFHLRWVAMPDQPFFSPVSLSFTLFILSALTCMGNSTLFHIFHCHSSFASHHLLVGDYSGIFVLIGGSFYPALFTGWSCHPTARAVYAIGITVQLIAGVTSVLFPFFHLKRFRFIRLIIYGLMGLFGVAPMIHARFVEPTPIVPEARFLQLYACYGIGWAVYLLRLPERLKPGFFDLWGHSHQIMHMSVVIASFYHYIVCLDAYAEWKAGPCAW